MTIHHFRIYKTRLNPVGHLIQRVVIAPEGLVFEPWLPEDFAEKEGDTLLWQDLINLTKVKFVFALSSNYY